MSALANFSPAAVTVVKLLAYPFRAAPTADIVADGVAFLAGGGTAAQLLNFLFNLKVPQSPFTAYASTSTDGTFASALVDNLTDGSAIGVAKKAAWVAELTPMVAQSATRGDLVMAVIAVVESYQGTDADVGSLKALFAARVATATAFAQSAAGALYNGQGFAQLLAPMAPPSYHLSADADVFNEGTSITLSLATTNVPAGTNLAYTLSGAGITAADLVGGSLSGTMTVDTSGKAHATLNLVADATTEGAETLHVSLGNGAAQLDLKINDSSVAPAPTPTYSLVASPVAQNEGSDIVFTLSTTQVAAGTALTYSLSGAGITAADVVGGLLSGLFTVGADGTASSTVHLAADATTEGTEVLRLQLSGNLAQIDATVNDTSLTPPPAPTPDLVLIADAMTSSHAGPPATPAEGEIKINTYLSADLLDQRGAVPLRMSLADLMATSATAGAPLDTTNHRADRGNIAQLSNQALFKFDLGGGIDRVDYSAESGRIVAVVSNEVAADTQYVLVNDNATDRVFDQASDRMDLLKGVEEVVASAGGGVLDLTAWGRDLTLNFSRNFRPAFDTDMVKDREQHRIELVDTATGVPLDRAYFEYRDAGFDAGVIQPLAIWSVVEGSDRNETLVFTSFEAQDQRASHLRGGINSVKFNELTASILVDVGIAPWVASTNLADDTNASGVVTATTLFTVGDGVTLLGVNGNITTSHTPDNAVAPGLLKIAGSQDAEDAVSFQATNLPKLITLGQTINGSDVLSVRLVAGPSSSAIELSGFELLRDNGASDDVYVVANIVKATLGHPKLVDAAGDHDTVRLATEALASTAVGGVAGTVQLDTLNAVGTGFNFDFDVLDLSAVNATALTVVGTAGTDDELVVGALSTLAAVSQFESLVLTDASIDKGAALIFDLDGGAVRAGATKLFNYSGSVLSAGGEVFGTAGQAAAVAPVATGMSFTVIDSGAGAGATVWGGRGPDILIGGAGDDTLRGGSGNDTLSGGLLAETWSFSLGGTPDAVAAAANRLTITMTIDGTVLTLVEAAVADTAYGDGNGAVVDGSSVSVIGPALAGLVNGNLAAINAGPGSGLLTDASYNPITGSLLLSFAPGVNANDVVSVALNSGTGPDVGSFSLLAGPHRDGSDGGADTMVFEATGALNGSDTVVDFTKASDKLRVTAFTGGAVTSAGVPISGATGGAFAGLSRQVELVFAKASGSLSAADFATAATTGKFTLPEGSKCVVAVTADPTGSLGDAANTPVNLYYVDNGAAAGLSDLSVALVATISGPTELSLSDIYWGLG